MARNEARQAKVTAEHLAESRRLKALWESTKGRPSQEKFGLDYGIGTQGAVWRFLNGKDPLSMKAAKGFARGLGCDIAAFSPRLAQEVAALGEFAKQGTAQQPARGSVFEAVTPDEHELLDFFRNMDDDDHADLVREAAKRSAKFKAMQARIMAKIGVTTKDAEAANATKGIIARASVKADAHLKQRHLPLYGPTPHVRPPIAAEPELPFEDEPDEQA